MESVIAGDGARTPRTAGYAVLPRLREAKPQGRAHPPRSVVVRRFWLAMLGMGVVSALVVLVVYLSLRDPWRGEEPLDQDDKDDADACTAAVSASACHHQPGYCLWFGDEGGCVRPTYCEAMPNHRSLFRGPSNTISAAAYLFVGLYMLLCGLFDRCHAYLAPRGTELGSAPSASALDSPGVDLELVQTRPVGAPLDPGDGPELIVGRNPMVRMWPISVFGGVMNVFHAAANVYNHGCTCVRGADVDTGAMVSVVLFLAAYAGLVLLGSGDAAGTVVPTRFLLDEDLCFCPPRAPEPTCWQDRSRWAVPTISLVYGCLVLTVFVADDTDVTGAIFVLGIIFAFLFSVVHYHRTTVGLRQGLPENSVEQEAANEDAPTPLSSPEPTVKQSHRKPQRRPCQGDDPRVTVLVATAVFLIAAFGAWWNEYWHQKCTWSRTFPLQPHSIWHILTGTALLLGYVYGRTMGCSRGASGPGQEHEPGDESGLPTDMADCRPSTGTGGHSMCPRRQKALVWCRRPSIMKIDPAVRMVLYI